MEPTLCGSAGNDDVLRRATGPDRVQAGRPRECCVDALVFDDRVDRSVDRKRSKACQRYRGGEFENGGLRRRERR